MAMRGGGDTSASAFQTGDMGIGGRSVTLLPEVNPVPIRAYSGGYSSVYGGVQSQPSQSYQPSQPFSIQPMMIPMMASAVASDFGSEFPSVVPSAPSAPSVPSVPSAPVAVAAASSAPPAPVASSAAAPIPAPAMSKKTTATPQTAEKEMTLFGEVISLPDPSKQATNAPLTSGQLRALELFGLLHDSVTPLEKKRVLEVLYNGTCSTDKNLMMLDKCEPIRQIVKSLALRLLSNYGTTNARTINTIQRNQSAKVVSERLDDGSNRICITYKADGHGNDEKKQGPDEEKGPNEMNQLNQGPDRETDASHFTKRGIHNQNIKCFCISAIQLLYSIPSIRNAILRYSCPATMIVNDIVKKKEVTDAQEIVCVIRSIFKDLFNNTGSFDLSATMEDVESSKPIGKPNRIAFLVKLIFPQNQNNKQQDAMEMVRGLLFYIEQIPSLARATAMLYSELTQEYRCLSTGAWSSGKTDKILDVPLYAKSLLEDSSEGVSLYKLGYSEQSGLSVENLIRYHGKEERSESLDVCDGQSGYVRYKVDPTPVSEFLVFTINRGSPSDAKVRVEIPSEVFMNQGQSGDAYRLFGIMLYKGTGDGGHYRYQRFFYPSSAEPGKRVAELPSVLYDDGRVRMASPSSEELMTDSYVLVYQRRSIPRPRSDTEEVEAEAEAEAEAEVEVEAEVEADTDTDAEAEENVSISKNTGIIYLQTLREEIDRQKSTFQDENEKLLRANLSQRAVVQSLVNEIDKLHPIDKNNAIDHLHQIIESSELKEDIIALSANKDTYAAGFLEQEYLQREWEYHKEKNSGSDKTREAKNRYDHALQETAVAEQKWTESSIEVERKIKYVIDQVKRHLLHLENLSKIRPDEILALFETLGMRPSIDKNAINIAFRKLAVTTHPNKGGDSEAFKTIQSAHEKLLEIVSYFPTRAKVEVLIKGEQTAIVPYQGDEKYNESVNQEAERQEAERQEAEKQEAERLEAERLEAEEKLRIDKEKYDRLKKKADDDLQRRVEEAQKEVAAEKAKQEQALKGKQAYFASIKAKKNANNAQAIKEAEAKAKDAEVQAKEAERKAKEAEDRQSALNVSKQIMDAVQLQIDEKQMEINQSAPLPLHLGGRGGRGGSSTTSTEPATEPTETECYFKYRSARKCLFAKEKYGTCATIKYSDGGSSCCCCFG